METCKDIAFSTSEDFRTYGPLNTIISDGDLLGDNCTICARNAVLLAVFEVNENHDLGLDAVDVIDVDGFLVAFSTELDSSTSGQFKAGDLLTTNKVVIPNRALTYLFEPTGIGISYDLGLDAVHFVGAIENIEAFLAEAGEIPREGWLDPLDLLVGMLQNFEIDIWFSTEGTYGPVGTPIFLDGDLLSAKYGNIVASNDELLPAPSVPAGIPDRGVDFGLDAVTSIRTSGDGFIHFSTELLYENDTNFSDGDVLLYDNGLVYTNPNLVGCFEPKADMLGLDALYLGNISTNSIYLPFMQNSQGPE